MSRILTEHETTVKSKRSKKSKERKRVGGGPSGRIEPVGGGSVRRIEFDSDESVDDESMADAAMGEGWDPDRSEEARREPEQPVGRRFVMPSDDEMSDIHRQVDRLRDPRTRPSASTEARRIREHVIHETGSGEVSEATGPDSDRGSRRSLYTRERKKERVSRQVTRADVDKLLVANAGRLQSEAAGGKTSNKKQATKARKATKKTSGVAKLRRTTKKSAPKKTASPTRLRETTTKPAKKQEKKTPKKTKPTTKPAKKRGKKSSKKTKPTTKKQKAGKKEAATASKQPTPDESRLLAAKTTQCAAITADKKQCSNRSQLDSKYCGIHHNYRPTSEQKEHGKTARCTAITASGKQCVRHSQADSKYCGIHKKSAKPKGQKSTKATKKKSGGAKPKQAAKTTRCNAKTASGKRCSRSARTNSKYCGIHKG